MCWDQQQCESNIQNRLGPPWIKGKKRIIIAIKEMRELATSKSYFIPALKKKKIFQQLPSGLLSSDKAHTLSWWFCRWYHHIRVGAKPKLRYWTQQVPAWKNKAPDAQVICVPWNSDKLETKHTSCRREFVRYMVDHSLDRMHRTWYREQARSNTTLSEKRKMVGDMDAMI